MTPDFLGTQSSGMCKKASDGGTWMRPDEHMANPDADGVLGLGGGSPTVGSHRPSCHCL